VLFTTDPLVACGGSDIGGRQGNRSLHGLNQKLFSRSNPFRICQSERDTSAFQNSLNPAAYSRHISSPVL
jgi:hypothetical protein